MMNLKKNIIIPSDIDLIKTVYRLGEENGGRENFSKENPRITSKNYNTNLVNSETFFCDLRNDKLSDVLKKYITLYENQYIINIHYIKYKIGERALPHIDKGYLTYIILLNNDFDGGEFYINDQNINLQIGDLLSYDGNTTHEVKPIKNGTREVLVIFTERLRKEKNSLI